MYESEIDLVQVLVGLEFLLVNLEKRAKREWLAYKSRMAGVGVMF